ncbi:MAG: helix-turn-helix transcriptional regulator [Eubacteriales bacterium]|nr:helix-turn-helix transcriptional regulator [Eubacteriales bacterium]MDD4421811.1 helix-turn-helix transcriptional regulator [Eubacteriales bacterium]HBR30516.1 hypothetical protein [Clostridiales bacterium]
MYTIGEKITELRKSKGMTQEELANLIGVSAQSVSKWENNVTMPDIMLLPVIADIFGISVDMLYGRDGLEERVQFTDVYDMIKDQFLTTILKAFHDEYDKVSFGDRLEECKTNLSKMPSSQIGIISGRNGAVYYSEPTGGIFIPHNCIESKLLEDESIEKILECLQNKSYRTILQYISENKNSSFTSSTIAIKYSLDENGVCDILDELVTQNFLVRENIDTGDAKINIYRTVTELKSRFILLFAAMTYLKRFFEFKPNYYSWCG